MWIILSFASLFVEKREKRRMLKQIFINQYTYYFVKQQFSILCKKKQKVRTWNIMIQLNINCYS